MVQLPVCVCVHFPQYVRGCTTWWTANNNNNNNNNMFPLTWRLASIFSWYARVAATICSSPWYLLTGLKVAEYRDGFDDEQVSTPSTWQQTGMVIWTHHEWYGYVVGANQHHSTTLMTESLMRNITGLLYLLTVGNIKNNNNNPQTFACVEP